ncbi:MAG: methyltransferase domain-containing protein [Pyrinomonadaceae bacterium]
MISNPLYRQDEIVRLCTGKTVLHLGFILHDQWRERLAQGNWLHARILKVAKRAIGLDFLASEVQAIRESTDGEYVVGDCLDLDNAPVQGTFDMIVCGELIEHLENPRALLDGIRRFCHAETQVILTTPNPWDRKWIQKTHIGVAEGEWLNPQHVFWFSMQTLKNFLERCGYETTRATRYFEESKGLDAGMSAAGRLHWRVKRLARQLVTPADCQPGLFFVVHPRANAES